ncbi:MULTISPECIES: efflux RND transporter periplasmic adaptor subunit [Erythrobacteraceae]|uniref:efflux RND transporter periplasmic adaptor subunit n=1 Tax=Erythrobacteraceae TaxID=335929 RepID=UPI0004D84A18|nr:MULTISPECIES: efflux RND transporter periplasmic adaptor subunit [Erythrobacteraceae]KEO86807.1 RND transporter [Erythrobacter sp. JL475]MBE5073306.1 efflux RND transporter periplasmic adaptor subunit [Erythrobacteraceae bacterium E2-1 Yellow Sea]MBX7541874.1 efflux RND transporter periplasmic adaptor subunit [Qipengyuania sphaerica]MCK0099591.1 efflux RND transporter periplasmic adaptor subunit [Qipengyuania sp. S6317L1]QIQ86418.1 MAG: efflux RND transporter periplasmic adaptor subunit [Er
MSDAIKSSGLSKRTYAIITAVALVSLGVGYALSLLGGESEGGMSGSSETECEEVLYWYDPMVPGQRFDEPGKSPFMDMMLVPKCAGEAAEAGVRIDPGLVQNFGIRTAAAEFGVLEPEITVTGVLAYNSRDVAIVQPRAGGYVQRTYGLAKDDVVGRGAPIVDILVPDWGGAQREYLAVLDTGDAALADAMRQRMRLLGMTNAMIASVERTRRAQTTITVAAPVGGAVTMLGVRPGMTVMEGQTLAEITGFSPIWLEASVPETQAANVRQGQTVSATLAAFPDERFAGRITAILPSADAASRTITVRAELPNPRGRLKPGMFAQVSLSPDTRRALLVPSEAVIRTGRRNLVMLKQDEGAFLPAEVEIGREANGRTEILAGLAEGEEVVTSGQFLIDSEASLAGIDVRSIDGSMDMASDGPAKMKTYTATGSITKIAGASITLNHAPVPALEWPSMVMPFALADASLVEGLEPGDDVEFTFSQADTGPRIESIRKVER